MIKFEKGKTSKDIIKEETQTSEGVVHSSLYSHKVEGKKRLVYVNGFAISYETKRVVVICSDCRTHEIWTIEKEEFLSQFNKLT